MNFPFSSDRLVIARFLAKIAILVGVMVMVAWSLGGISALTTILSGRPSMKFSTALSFVLSGLLLYALAKARATNQPFPRLLVGFVAASVLIIMVLILSILFFHVSFGIEGVLVFQNPGTPQESYPGLPSIGTAMALILIGLLALLGFIVKRVPGDLFMYGGAVISALGIRGMAGYLLNQPLLYFLIPGTSDGMSIHSASLFICLGFGFFLLGRECILPSPLKRMVSH